MRKLGIKLAKMLEIFSSFLVSFSEYFPIISEKVKKGKFLYFRVRKYDICNSGFVLNHTTEVL